MLNRKWKAALATAAVGALLAVGAAACGDAEEADPTPVLTPKITPASGRTAVSTSQPTAEATGAATTPAGGETPASGETQEFTIVGQSTLFDVTELNAKPGQLAITFKNQDAGILHNLAFWKGSEASGDPVAATELKAGPVEDTLTFAVEAGEYYYQCDAHPATMNGKLTVE